MLIILCSSAQNQYYRYPEQRKQICEQKYQKEQQIFRDSDQNLIINQNPSRRPEKSRYRNDLKQKEKRLENEVHQNFENRRKSIDIINEEEYQDQENDNPMNLEGEMPYGEMNLRNKKQYGDIDYFDIGNLKDSFIFKNLYYDDCSINENSKIWIIFFYISLILFFFLSIYGLFLNIMSVVTRDSLKDLILHPDNLTLFGSLIAIGVFLILFIFLVIKYKLYNIFHDDCDNFILDLKAIDLEQEIIEIIFLYNDKKSQSDIIKIFFKNENISSITKIIKKMDDDYVENEQHKNQMEDINERITNLLEIYQRIKNSLKLYKRTPSIYQKTGDIENKSNSILLFLKNCRYITVFLIIMLILAIAFSFAGENLKILNPILCSIVFLFFILYFIFFIFFIIKVRQDNIEKYKEFFKNLKCVENGTRTKPLTNKPEISNHQFTNKLVNSYEYTPTADQYS